MGVKPHKLSIKEQHPKDDIENDKEHIEAKKMPNFNTQNGKIMKDQHKFSNHANQKKIL
jgi:hypothetical protein